MYCISEVHVVYIYCTFQYQNHPFLIFCIIIPTEICNPMLKINPSEYNISVTFMIKSHELSQLPVSQINQHV